MVRLVPRETKFFEMFASMSANLMQGAQLLKNWLTTIAGGATG